MVMALLGVVVAMAAPSIREFGRGRGGPATCGGYFCVQFVTSSVPPSRWSLPIENRS